MNDVFRIVRGLEIDRAVQILQGSIPPGSTTDTNNAPVGSIYLQTVGGSIYSKTTVGTGTGTWALSSGGGSLLKLYSEVSSTPTPPVALGSNSIALGSGANTSSTSPNSLAIGNGSLTTIPAAIAFAGGSFATVGDAQAGEYLLRNITTTSTPTEIFVDGTSATQRLILPNNSTWTFNAMVTGHRTDVSDGHAGYTATGVIYRGASAAATAIQGTVSKVVVAESNTPWDIAVTADAVNGALVVFVTGQSAKTIRWTAHIRTVQITN